MSNGWKDFGFRVGAVALFVLLILFVQALSARADESVPAFDTFACPDAALMDSFAAGGVVAEHKVCSLLNWNVSVGKHNFLRTLKAGYVVKLQGKQSRFAGRPELFVIEVQGRKLYAIKNPAFDGAWKTVVTGNLLPDYPYKSWMRQYWVVVV